MDKKMHVDGATKFGACDVTPFNLLDSLAVFMFQESRCFRVQTQPSRWFLSRLDAQERDCSKLKLKMV